MEIGWMFVFRFAAAALNLFVSGATGRVHDFWSGRRGGAKLVGDLKSPLARLALACLGATFVTAAVLLAVHLLERLQGTPHL